MRLDVFLSPLGLAPGDLAGRTVLVLDVLRATTTMCAAMHAGARAVVPVAEPDDARRLAEGLGPEALLAGERGAVRSSPGPRPTTPGGWPRASGPRPCSPASAGRCGFPDSTSATAPWR